MYEYRVVVCSVHDGDTFRADVDLGFDVWIKNTAFRLNRINTPELKGDTLVRAREARDALRELLPVGGEAIVRTQKDKTEKYGRMLADVFVNGTMLVNDLLVVRGFAKYWDGTGVAPV